jgi:hypothetical protein
MSPRYEGKPKVTFADVIGIGVGVSEGAGY